MSPPRRIGRYDLYGAIASGGMATVHFARMVGPVGFGRTVAVKRLHRRHAGDADVLAMLVDEARLAGRIQHPNVLAAFDVVALEQELFLVMDYVRGESLARLVRTVSAQGGGLPARIASSIACGVLYGLHEAHEAKNERGEPLGIVHRDVSPQNVLVGVDGVARVLDFGIAKATQRIQKATLSGQIKGKLSYMAPEQVAGDPVDRRTDVWSVAVVLWEMLTGHRLFSGPEPAATIHRIARGIVDAPSKLVPGLPAGLDAVVLRGLRTDPAERHQTASEMAHALEAAVSPATTREVAQLVQTLAGDALRERAAAVAEIERAAADAEEPTTSTLATAVLAAPRVSGPVPDASRQPPEDGATQLTNVTTPSRVRRARTQRVAAASLLIVASGLTALAMVTRRVDPIPEVVAPAASPQSAAPTPPAEPPVEPASPSVPASEAPTTAPVVATGAAPIQAKPGPLPAPSQARSAAPPPSAAPQPMPVDECANPFSYERDGDRVIKKWKPQCVNR